MYGWNNGWGVGAWLAMGLMMVVFWGLIVALVIVLVRSAGRHGEGHAASGGPREDSALRILDERFARGDIDTEEYTRRRDVLGPR